MGNKTGDVFLSVVTCVLSVLRSSVSSLLISFNRQEDCPLQLTTCKVLLRLTLRSPCSFSLFVCMRAPHIEKKESNYKRGVSQTSVWAVNMVLVFEDIQLQETKSSVDGDCHQMARSLLVEAGEREPPNLD